MFLRLFLSIYVIYLASLHLHTAEIATFSRLQERVINVQWCCFCARLFWLGHCRTPRGADGRIASREMGPDSDRHGPCCYCCCCCLRCTCCILLVLFIVPFGRSCRSFRSFRLTNIHKIRRELIQFSHSRRENNLTSNTFYAVSRCIVRQTEHYTSF